MIGGINIHTSGAPMNDGTAAWTYNEVAQDSRNPDYHQLVTEGKRIPCTPYYHRMDRIDNIECHYTRYDGLAGSYIKTPGQMGSCQTVPLDYIAFNNMNTRNGAVLAEANNAALSNLRLGEFDLAMAIAGIKDTSMLVKMTAIRLASAFSQLKRGRIIDAAKTLRLPNKKKVSLLDRDYRNRRITPQQLVADGWLELQFGWGPLLSDVHTSAEALAQKNLTSPGEVFKATGFAKREESVLGYKLDTGAIPLRERRITHECHSKTVIYAMITQWEIYLASSMGLSNPSKVAWDVIPFSFVADWFYPFAKTLESLNATQGLVFVDGSQSLYTKWTDSITYTTNPKYAWAHSVTVPGYLANQGENYDRSKLGSFPSTMVPPLDLRLEMSKWQIGTSLALLQTVFGGRRDFRGLRV